MAGNVSSAGPTRRSMTIAEARSLETATRDPGATGIDFERHEPAADRQRPREPDAAVTAQRTDLENPPRTVHPRQQGKEAALRSRHVDRR